MGNFPFVHFRLIEGFNLRKLSLFLFPGTFFKARCLCSIVQFFEVRVLGVFIFGNGGDHSSSESSELSSSTCTILFDKADSGVSSGEFVICDRSVPPISY